jgi:tetratricopeptide (TPR) repeat protein
MNQVRQPFWEVFRALVDFTLRPEYRAELERASQEYFGTARPHEGGLPLHGRDGAWGEGVEYLAFLEWMIFDRAWFVDRNPLIEAFLESTSSLGRDEREDVASWMRSRLCFYEVSDIAVNGIFVKDLLRTSGQLDFYVAEAPASLHLGRGNLIMVRLLRWGGDLHLAGAVNVFPEGARHTLLDYLYEIRSKLSPESFSDVLRSVLPALCKQQTAVSLEEEALFPGGYPEALSSGTVETLVAHGRSCLERGELSDALRCFQRALYAEPLHVAARGGVGVVHLKRGELDQARRAFESILETHPDDAVALLNLGNVFVMSGQMEQASALLERARDAADDEAVRAHAWFNLGLCSLALDNDSQGIRCFKEASKMADHLDNPNEAASLHFRIGSNLAASERFSAALTYFRKTVRCVPDFGEGHLHLAESYARLERWRDAVREYRLAVRLGCGTGRTWLELGKCQLQLEHHRRAEEALWHAIELLPGLVDAHHWLARALMAQNRLDEAQYRCEIALSHAPGSGAVDVLVTLAEIAHRLGDPKASTRYLRRALRLEPQHVEARGLLARVRKEERTVCT